MDQQTLTDYTFLLTSNHAQERILSPCIGKSLLCMTKEFSVEAGAVPRSTPSLNPPKNRCLVIYFFMEIGLCLMLSLATCQVPWACPRTLAAPQQHPFHVHCAYTRMCAPCSFVSLTPPPPLQSTCGDSVLAMRGMPCGNQLSHPDV